MSARTTIILALSLLAGTAPASAQDCGDLLDSGQVLDLFIEMDPADWDALRFSCPGGFCGPQPYHYWNAMLRCEDGPEIEVGIRRKRGGALPSEEDPQKPAIKIDINEFVPGQTFSGKVKLNLENGGGSAGPPPDPTATGAVGGGGDGLKEGFAWLLYGDTGIVSSRAAWTKLWINGDYKGLYMHVEQVDKSFLVDHGIDEGGWLFKGPSNEQRTRESEPNPFAFNWYPFDHVSPEDPQPADWHDQTEWRVDMPQLLTLAAVTNFVGNKDGAIFKNNNYWYYDWSVFPQGQQPRLYLGWDLDTVMGPQEADLPILGIPHNSGHMAQALIHDDPAFQAQYYQIYNALMNGPLSLASTTARLDALETIISTAMDADPYSGDAAGEFQMVRDFLTARTAFVLGALGDCPNAVCDPGESPCTCPADCGAPPVTESTCSDSLDEDCDGPVDCADADCETDPACQASPVPNEILVTEVVANSPGSPDVEYVEILNAGTGVQDLTGWYLLDDDNAHDKCYLDAALEPGEYLIVAGFVDEFLQRYPEAASNLNPNAFDSDVAGVGFSLGDGGDSVRLYRPGSPEDIFVDGYTFGPQAEEIPFGFVPEASDAPEYITFPTPAGNNGLADPYSPVCINEFLTTSQAGGVDDWIELYNRGVATVDISGWYLSDTASNPTKYSFPPGTTIPPGGFIRVDESELGFALSSTGSEVVVLTHADGETGQDYFDYGLQFPDVTQGRYPDGAPYWLLFTVPSPGYSNACRVTGLRFTSGVDMAWDPGTDISAYDLIKGDLNLLRSTQGDFAAAAATCAENDLTATTASALDQPASGQTIFYLVRAVDPPCGLTTYDAASSVQAASRDAGINAAPAACP